MKNPILWAGLMTMVSTVYAESENLLTMTVEQAKNNNEILSPLLTQPPLHLALNNLAAATESTTIPTPASTTTTTITTPAGTVTPTTTTPASVTTTTTPATSTTAPSITVTTPASTSPASDTTNTAPTTTTTTTVPASITTTPGATTTTPAATTTTPSSSTTPASPSSATVPQAINCNYRIPASTTRIEQNIVLKWAEQAAEQSFNFDFNSIDNQLSVLKSCYTEQGWVGFNDALQKSGNLNAIKSQQLTVSSMVDGETKLTEIKDNQWKVTIPMQVVYQNDKEKLTQPLTINLVVGRKVSGDLGIMQMIAIPRQSSTSTTAPATP